MDLGLDENDRFGRVVHVRRRESGVWVLCRGDIGDRGGSWGAIDKGGRVTDGHRGPCYADVAAQGTTVFGSTSDLVLETDSDHDVETRPFLRENVTAENVAQAFYRYPASCSPNRNSK